LVTPTDGYFFNYKSFFTFLIILKLNNIWFCYVIVWSDTDTNQLHSIIFFKLFYIGPKFEINKINKECGHSFDYPQKKGIHSIANHWMAVYIDREQMTKIT